MTVPATTRRAGPFNGNDSSTSFPFTFRVFSKDDIQVQLANTVGISSTLVLDSDYSVTLNVDQDATPGGSITYPISGDPLAVGEKLVILGAVPYEQTTDLPAGGAYRASVVEDALDRTAMQVQQLSEELGRALTLPAAAAGADTTLPVPVANNFIGWDEAASALRNVDPSTAASIVAYATWRTEVFNGGASSYTLAADPGSVNNCDVAVGGVVQTPGVDFTVSGTTLTPTPAWPAGTGNVVVRYGQALPQGTTDSAASTYTPAVAGTVARDVQTKLREQLVSVADFPSVAGAAASSAAALVFPAGEYAIGANLTFGVPVTFLPGAVLNIATGVIVTFNGGFSAGIHQCFSCVGTGAVVFNPAKTLEGYAEWWGATPNVVSDAARAANVAAINAALVALTRVTLLPADYHTNARILHAVHGHALVGANCHSFGGTQGFVTNILCNSATATILQIGPDTYPGSINALTQGIYAADIQLRRTVAPTISSGCAGLKMQYVLKATIERVFSTESMRGFEFFNTVACRADKCEARRSLVGGGGGTDVWYGYYANGNNATPGWGLPGGNASLYLTYSNASCNEVGLQASGSSGFYFDQQFTDIFVSWCEAGDCEVGINIQGNSAAGTSYGNTDLHLSRCIIDTPRLFGVFIKNMAAAGTVDIEGLYCAPSSAAVSAATAALYVQDSGGSVNVAGGQLLLGPSTVARGVVIDNSSGVSVVGTQISEATAPPVLLAVARNCVIRPLLSNAGAAGGVAVQLSGACTANTVAPTVKGKASAFTKGIDVSGTTDARNEYNLTGVDSTCIAGGSANKLVRNAVQITATGLSGTNLVSGVMA